MSNMNLIKIKEYPANAYTNAEHYMCDYNGHYMRKISSISEDVKFSDPTNPVDLDDVLDIYDINITQILLMPSIKKYIEQNHSDLDLDIFSDRLDEKEIGDLTKMDFMIGMTKSQFIKWLQKNPISLMCQNCEMLDRMNNQFYDGSWFEIIDGRHRLAYAIIQGLEKIPAIVYFAK